MNGYSRSERESLSKDKSKLLELQREEVTIEAEDHDGSVDAVRLTRVKSKMEEGETDIFYEKVRNENKEP